LPMRCYTRTSNVPVMPLLNFWWEWFLICHLYASGILVPISMLPSIFTS
jgi:hypothetical protein